MNKIELLILHGPPGSGKTSISQTMSKLLRQHDIAHAVIDLDYLAKIHPRKHIGIMYKNLDSIWPNYQAIGDMKIIIPTYLQKGEFEIVTTAAPAYKTQVCEVLAPVEILEERIKEREKTDFQVKLHLDYLYQYPSNGPDKNQIDFQVTNHNQSKEQTAMEILQKASWI
jgi:ABC-type multidrug transport system ATPase subunit